MTSSIDTNNYHKNMNLTIINNSSKLSSFEQKNLAILILARYKLEFYVMKNNSDIFINKLYDWLLNNVMNFRDIEIVYTTYYNTKENTKLKKDLFRIVKPLEELAFYLSKLAERNNTLKDENINNDELILIKAYTLNLISYWFNSLKKSTYYFKDIYNFKFEEELEKINKNKSNDRKQLNIVYDYSIDVSEFLSKYSYKIEISAIKGSKKRK